MLASGARGETSFLQLGLHEKGRDTPGAFLDVARCNPIHRVHIDARGSILLHGAH